MSTAIAKRSHSTLDMTKGSILKNLLLFAIPLMCTNLLQLFFNAADMIVIGQFSDTPNAVGAIGATGSIINLFVNFFMGLSIGATVIVARHFGAKQEEEMSKAVHTAVLLSIVSGICLTVLGVLLSKSMLSLMGTPEDMLDLSAEYLSIYFGGIVVTMIYNFGSAILRAVGDTRRPLIFLAIGGVINVCFNLFFVIVLKMNVAGVAIATVISQTISAALVLICLAHEKGGLKLKFSKLRMHRDKLLSIIRLGIPAGIQSSLFSVSNIFIQSSINSFGSVIVNGNAAASNIEHFIYTPMNAFHHASLSFTSQNMGAGQNKRISKAMILSPLCATIIGLAIGWTAYLLATPLLSLYVSTPAEITAGIERMSIVATMYFMCGAMDAISGISRGAGYSVAPTLINLIGVCILRLIWIFTVFTLPSFHTVHGLLLCYPITWGIVIIAHVMMYVFFVRQGIKKHCESVHLV